MARVDKAVWEVAAQRYLSGENIHDLAKEYGVNESSIHYHARKAGGKRERARRMKAEEAMRQQAIPYPPRIALLEDGINGRKKRFYERYGIPPDEGDRELRAILNLNYKLMSEKKEYQEILKRSNANNQ